MNDIQPYDIRSANAIASGEASRTSAIGLHARIARDAPHAIRPVARGKFLFVGDEKLYVRGVTYGTFRPGEQGDEYDFRTVEQDFAMMAKAGINAIRVYTVPPRWLLDIALGYGLRVMVGLPWEQHVAFLDNPGIVLAIEQRVREGVRACAGHPAILCFAVGNEIPSSIVRWHGATRIERFLEHLASIVRMEDRDALVTYVNYPSTEYLRLDWADFLSFNVYLESREDLDAYLARLQNLAGERPLMVAEIGLDSARNGVEGQAASLSWQIRTVFAHAACGAVVFAWTDEWHRGGTDVLDWDFGLVNRERQPKPALAAASQAFARVPFGGETAWPRMSVIVCSYNGARTIGETLEGISRLDYPDYEVIVVDDGSTDDTASIAAAFDVRLIRTRNAGLSSARNTGMRATTGEILAYIDDDAWPDKDWLSYLATTYAALDVIAVGGPNVAPAGDGWIAEAVANAPGGPLHVLLTDTIADHIPGCNFSVRKACLEAIGGFDPRFRIAGDDVDVCWRLQERGWKIGFSPGALVWHHRRNSVRTYWKQQQGYGKAEALLEHKWPERYNAMGHLTWSGRIYGRGLTLPMLGRAARIYGGTWGAAAFQSMYVARTGPLASLPLMPEWWILVVVSGAFALLGFAWEPLLVGFPLFGIALMAPMCQALLSARHAISMSRATRIKLLKLYVLIAVLHLIGPVGRLRGRIRHRLTPWRLRGQTGLRWPVPLATSHWSEQWHAPETWLSEVERSLRAMGAVSVRGGSFERWDIAVRGGLLGSARLLMAIEEHGDGKQMCQFRITPAASVMTLTPLAILTVLGVAAGLRDAWLAAGILAILSVATAARIALETGRAMHALTAALPGVQP